MKIDQIKLLSLVSWITSHSDHAFDEYEMEIFVSKIHNLEVIEAQVPYQPPKADIQLVDVLMQLMMEGQRKIEAIKVHRQLTGLGLKESKDAVEKYWVSKLENG